MPDRGAPWGSERRESVEWLWVFANVVIQESHVCCWISCECVYQHNWPMDRYSQRLRQCPGREMAPRESIVKRCVWRRHAPGRLFEGSRLMPTLFLGSGQVCSDLPHISCLQPPARGERETAMQARGSGYEPVSRGARWASRLKSFASVLSPIRARNSGASVSGAT